MSLPGDRKIDTDLTESPDPHEIIHDVCDVLENKLEKIYRAITVMKDVDSSREAHKLAVQVLEDESKGNLQLLRTIREQTTRLQEEIDSISND